MGKIQNIRVIQEFDSSLGIRGIYEFSFDGETKVAVRKDNDIYAIVHLSDKPELMLIRSDVSDKIIAALETK